MQQRLIVISADGLVGEDIQAMESMPGFRKYFSRCARVEAMRSIYPTITYPCHTTMCTGVYPDKHGVFGNLIFSPGGQSLPWRWFRDQNRWQEDIFRAAKREGLTTAAIFWPVTGRHPDIDWLIPEYWPQTPDQTPADAFREGGSSPEVLEIVERWLPGVTVRTHPGTDDFMVHCACDFIRRFSPDLLMLHPGNVDGYRHGHGVFSPEAARGVEETDRYLSEIMDTLAETGLIHRTNVVLTSDHGLIDVQRVVQLNQLLARKGLLEIAGEAGFSRWDACALSGGTSALVYLNPRAPKGTWQRTYDALLELKEEGGWGIGQVLTQEETQRQERLGGDFAFVVETDGITAYGDRLLPPEVTLYGEGDSRSGRATHGHLPDKGPQPVLLGVGPGFREGAVLSRARLVDGAPTYARLLGVHLRGADGQPLDALLR